MSSKDAAKPKSQKKSAKRGKRYSEAEKAEVVDFVNKVNAEKGRGGQSAAAAKFNISPLTVASWLKTSGAPSTKKKVSRGSKAVKTATGTPLAKKLNQLQSLNDEIVKTEALLEDLKAQFDAVKATL
ncbi:MAG: hypothetical protein ACQKBU_00170 [Verrucomicrobiales bacterium]